MNRRSSSSLAIRQCKEQANIIIPVHKSEMETILGAYAMHGILQASGPSCWLYYGCTALRPIYIPGLYELYKLGSRPLFPPYLITASSILLLIILLRPSTRLVVVFSYLILDIVEGPSLQKPSEWLVVHSDVMYYPVFR